jgi:hypothetical protein
MNVRNLSAAVVVALSILTSPAAAAGQTVRGQAEHLWEGHIRGALYCSGLIPPGRDCSLKSSRIATRCVPPLGVDVISKQRSGEWVGRQPALVYLIRSESIGYRPKISKGYRVP